MNYRLVSHGDNNGGEWDAQRVEMMHAAREQRRAMAMGHVGTVGVMHGSYPYLYRNTEVTFALPKERSPALAPGP